MRYKDTTTEEIEKTERPNVGKDVWPELACIIDGSIKSYNHFGKNSISYKTKHAFTLWPRNFTPRYWSKKNEKNIYMYTKRWVQGYL